MKEHMPPILHLEDTKEKPMQIKLNDNKITGIQEYTVTRKTCDPFVELKLKLVCYIGEIKIDREKISKSK